MFFKLTAIRYSIEAKILVLVINIPYHKLKSIYRQFRLCITKASGKAHTPMVARILRLPPGGFSLVPL